MRRLTFMNSWIFKISFTITSSFSTFFGCPGVQILRVNATFKELRGFEQYKQYYVKREDAQAIFEREVSKRSSGFADYIDVSCHSHSLSLFLTEHCLSSLCSVLSTNRTSQVTEWDYVNFLWSLFNGFHDTHYFFAPCSSTCRQMIHREPK